jgi:diacylglycerol O-acyltransferase
MYLIEGLAGGRVALLTKSHHVLVDGVDTVDIGQVLLDPSREPKEFDVDEWAPHDPPSPFTLLTGALRDSLTDADTIVGTAAASAGAVLRGVAGTARTTGRVIEAITNRAPRSESPIFGPLSQQRRVVTVATKLADYRKVRQAHGGSVNDVVLATITGALRAWLMSSGESMGGVRQIRTLAPVSVIDDELEPTSLGSQIVAHFVDLPVGEASPVVRLHQVSYSFKAHQEAGHGIPASRLAGMSGFAPATFHALAARVAGLERRRGYQLCVTNVPGPQAPLYAAGAKMVATYSVPPLFEGRPLAIGVTSYNGSVFYGLNADRDLPGDADLLGVCIVEALEELLESVTAGRNRAPRGRRRPSGKGADKRVVRKATSGKGISGKRSSQ